ncbi:MAG: FlxA-like family protein [Sulfuriferula sp.]|jgi:hypothetical protein|nr:FlxA-like family protein [Sulfuriferula sp.]
MISATASTAITPIPNAGSPAGMESQLNRLQQQLSECVNCSTGGTPEGKAKAQAISDQISSLRTRIQEAPQVNLNPLQSVQTTDSNQFSFQNRPTPGAPVGSVINISV